MNDTVWYQSIESKYESVGSDSPSFAVMRRPTRKNTY